jgi:hypothetical protein
VITPFKLFSFNLGPRECADLRSARSSIEQGQRALCTSGMPIDATMGHIALGRGKREKAL